MALWYIFGVVRWWLTKVSIENLIRRGAIIVKKPDLLAGAIATNTSVDFSDLQDVHDLVYYSLDTDWLQRCIAKDNRPQVDKRCDERLSEIQQLKKRLTAQSSQAA